MEQARGLDPHRCGSQESAARAGGGKRQLNDMQDATAEACPACNKTFDSAAAMSHHLGSERDHVHDAFRHKKQKTEDPPLHQDAARRPPPSPPWKQGTGPVEFKEYIDGEWVTKYCD